jgi:ribonuclease HII
MRQGEGQFLGPWCTAVPFAPSASCTTSNPSEDQQQARFTPLFDAVSQCLPFIPSPSATAAAALTCCRAFADSKTLTEERRDKLFQAIQQDPTIGYHYDSLGAPAISAGMLSANRVSLNALAMDSTCALINRALQRGVNLTQVFVDTVGDAERHRATLAQRFPGIAFTVCPKADSIYPIVSAASIVAKVTRDRQLANWNPPGSLEVSRRFGSGYPGRVGGGMGGREGAHVHMWRERKAHVLFGSGG